MQYSHTVFACIVSLTSYLRLQYLITRCSALVFSHKRPALKLSDFVQLLFISCFSICNKSSLDTRSHVAWTLLQGTVAVKRFEWLYKKIAAVLDSRLFLLLFACFFVLFCQRPDLHQNMLEYAGTHRLGSRRHPRKWPFPMVHEQNHGKSEIPESLGGKPRVCQFIVPPRKSTDAARIGSTQVLWDGFVGWSRLGARFQPQDTFLLQRWQWLALEWQINRWIDR